MQIEFDAAPEVRAAIEGVGRTEDIHLSPSGRWLALAAFGRNAILVLGLRIDDSAELCVSLDQHFELRCADFNLPHGVFWIDERTLIVANRAGDSVIVELPAELPVGGVTTLVASQHIRSDSADRVKSPGSVAVSRIGPELHEVLICNNYVHHVSRHILDGREGFAVVGSSVLLREGLSIPDGVAISRDGKWVAISNHDHDCVFVYRNSPELGATSPPDAVLKGVRYPHGVRFSPDGRMVFAAAAGAPYVHVFAHDGDGWCGTLEAVANIRVMDEERFRRGQYNPQEGGPKGIVIDARGRVLMMSGSEEQLAFFDLRAALGGLLRPAEMQSDLEAEVNEVENLRRLLLWEARQLKQAEALVGEMQRSEEDGMSDKQLLQAIQASRSWRITAPLRWVAGKLGMH